jgi:hypothetical protein
MNTKSMSHATTMSKQNDFFVLTAGLLGLLLGVLMARPKRIPEAVFALMAGIFACLVIGPMIAEIFTNLSAYSYFSWVKATPDTSLYTGIIGLSSLLGYQMVLALKDDFLNWVRKFANKKLRMSNEEER